MCREVVSVAFSSDGKNVLTQGGAPDFTLVLWSIDKIAKVRTTHRDREGTPKGRAAGGWKASLAEH